MLNAPQNAISERLGHAILEIVAARAGCEVMQPPTDFKSIDAMIKPISPTVDGQIDVQIKGSAGLARDSAHIKFPLKIKNYNDLRSSNVMVPRMLVVADLAPSDTDWVSTSSDEVIFRRSVYWVDLHSLPATQNKTSVTIDIPLSNVLSAQALASLIGRSYANAKSGKGGLS